MECKAGQCKTSTPYSTFIVTPSLEQWPTKVKEAPSLLEGTGPAGHQPSISMIMQVIRFFKIFRKYWERFLDMSFDSDS